MRLGIEQRRERGCLANLYGSDGRSHRGIGDGTSVEERDDRRAVGRPAAARDIEWGTPAVVRRLVESAMRDEQFDHREWSALRRDVKRRLRAIAEPRIDIRFEEHARRCAILWARGARREARARSGVE